MKNNFYIKSHGLGNEYAIFDENNISFDMNRIAITRLCNVNFGIGTDGILLKVKSGKADVGLRIYNPDGSEAEKSGNGLRIFCKYLFDYNIINSDVFTVETLGGIVNARIIEKHNDRAKRISIDLGKAIFESNQIPTLFDTQIVDDEIITAKEKDFIVNCVSVGNPHCVIIKDILDIEEIKEYGQFIENHKLFPNRINVQFAKIIDRKNVDILIWERGAGYTLASGSSSAAVASVLLRKQLIDKEVTINMIGGRLEYKINDNWEINMTGEVRQICEGYINDEVIEDFKTPMPNNI